MKIIEYREEFGEVELPEGFEEELRGKSLGEQMERFRIASSISLTKTYYGEEGSSRVLEESRALDDDGGFVGLIVKDGVIVGVLIKSWRGREEPCLPNRCVCTYWASDNEGSGTNDREDYAYLICV